MFPNLAGYNFSLLKRSFVQLGAFASNEQSSNSVFKHNKKALNEIALDGQRM
jgi:hypothetical protein